jgi:FK506-binding nuclear protein
MYLCLCFTLQQVTKLPSGLIIEDIKVGEGANVRSGARVSQREISGKE